MSNMSKEEFELLKKLKERVLYYCNSARFDDQSVDRAERDFFYVSSAPGDCSAEYNLFERMAPQHIQEFSEGSGGELLDWPNARAKMRALRSSSAMTFNILGNRTCELASAIQIPISSGSYDIQYEYQLYTLKQPAARMPANLDAILSHVNKREVVACEMKMLEWLSKPGKVKHGDGSRQLLKEAYLNANNYLCFDDNPDTATAFAQLAATINVACKDSRYDAAQMFKHCMALYNSIYTKSLRDINKLTLLNCVWEPSFEVSDSVKRMLDEEHRGRDSFFRLLTPIITAFHAQHVTFSVVYSTAAELIGALQLSDEKLRYLKRYE